jgi:hypothetical protein
MMKALEKDRDRRYETASTLASNVQRYLHDEPVLAFPPSTGYRFRKSARRNKTSIDFAVFVDQATFRSTSRCAISPSHLMEWISTWLARIGYNGPIGRFRAVKERRGLI